MKKLIATISIITALGVGGFALNSVLPAGAVGNATTQATDPSAACGPRATFKGVLDKLVADGTITQAQADTIIQSMRDAVAENRSGPGGRGGPRLRVFEGMLQVSADTIGVSADDLKAALQSGQSVADVANAHSVKPTDVVTAIVAAGTAKLDQGSGGMLTQEQRDALKRRLPDIADRFVNHTKTC
ncbi:MAG: hypothetical protein QOI95_2777 [Acidimicrobiaceae bacterium]|jgi:hypothetical protein